MSSILQSLSSVQTSLSQTEVDQIQELLSQPVVKKYLVTLAIPVIGNICTGSPSDAQSDSDYIRKEATYKGQLSLLETLLSIQPVNIKE